MLSNALWGCGKLMWYPAPLMTAVSREVAARPAMLSRLGWSALMWSCSRFKLDPGPLFDILADQVLLTGALNPQDLPYPCCVEDAPGELSGRPSDMTSASTAPPGIMQCKA